MVLEILSNEFFSQLLLPFILIFTVVFAILQKTKIFGEDKKQIDSILALIFALIVVAVAQAVEIITALIPIVVIIIVVLLLFMLMFGFVGGRIEEIKWLKNTLAVILALALIVSVLWITGIFEQFKETINEQITQTAILVIVIIAAIIIIIKGAGKENISTTKP